MFSVVNNVGLITLQKMTKKTFENLNIGNMSSFIQSPHKDIDDLWIKMEIRSAQIQKQRKMKVILIKTEITRHISVIMVLIK